MTRKKIAVFFGEQSFEHDISILTGLQAIKVIDQSKFEVFPVYIDLNRNWWTGNGLLKQDNYPLAVKQLKDITKVKFCLGDGVGYLQPVSGGIFAAKKPIYFDAAFLAFHGDFGETGAFQGLMESAGIPYTGCRMLAANVFMNKVTTKQLCRTLGIPVLPEVVLNRPENKAFFDVKDITKDVNLPFPLCVKPLHLGSSIAVSKVTTKEELDSAVIKVFALDNQAIVEPFVENLEEYNVSVTRIFGEPSCSAIERPAKKNAILDFADKYKAGGKGKGVKGAKSGNADIRGLVSLSREYNPKELTKEQREKILSWAKTLFVAMDGNGAPRIDFLCNTKTGELWLGEVNPIPGSFAFYLWENAEPKVNFTKLLTAIIEEAFAEAGKKSLAYGTLKDNRIFEDK